jgi:hypothetical protein
MNILSFICRNGKSLLLLAYVIVMLWIMISFTYQAEDVVRQWTNPDQEILDILERE